MATRRERDRTHSGFQMQATRQLRMEASAPLNLAQPSCSELRSVSAWRTSADSINVKIASDARQFEQHMAPGSQMPRQCPARGIRTAIT